MSPSPVRLEVGAATVWKVALHLLLVAAIILTLWTARQVVAWLLVAAYLALALAPVVSFLRRRGWPRWGALLGTYLALLGIFAAVIVLLLPPAIEQGRQLVENAPELVERARQVGVVRWLDDQIGITERLEGAAQAGSTGSGAEAEPGEASGARSGGEPDGTQARSGGEPAGTQERSGGELAGTQARSGGEPAPPKDDAAGRIGMGEVASILRPVLAVLVGVASALTAAVAILVLSVFMLVYGNEVTASALSWLPAGQRPRGRALAQRMREAVSGYVAGTLVIALVGGVVTAVLLAILGVPFFLALGLLAGLLGVIPYLGAILAGVLVTATTMLTAGVTQGLIAGGVFLVYQQIEGDVLQPLVHKRTVQMNPLVLSVILLIGTAVWGVLGALLAVPVAASVKILLEDLKERRGQEEPDRGPDRERDRQAAPAPPKGAPP